MSFTDLNKFKKTAKAEWALLAQSDLKGADPFTRLRWQYDPDVEIDPYYDAAPAPHMQDLSLQPLSHSSVRSRVWHYLEHILLDDAKVANRRALAALNGSEGILWELPPAALPSAASVFEGIDTAYCQTAFALPQWSDTLEMFLAQLLKINSSPHGMLLYRGYSISESKQVMALFSGSENFRPLCFNTLPLHENGVSPSVEVAFLLSEFIEKADSLSSEYSIKDVITKSVFCIGLGRDYFHEIAKVRALKLLICKIAADFGAHGVEPSEVAVFGRPALRTFGVVDPHVNMVRVTSEAMAGIIGGVNYLTIPSFDHLHPFTPATFSKRIARNISNLLREESHLDKTNDPAAGSYYLETLTEKIGEAAWRKMQRAEEMGGFSKAVIAGLWEKEQAAFAANEERQAALRKINIVGINNFNDLDHFREFPSSQSYKAVTNSGLRSPGAPFELLRLTTEEWMKNNPTQPRPSVTTILFGEKNKAMARFNFVQGFFPAAGIGVQSPLWWEEAPRLPRQTKLAVLCSSDDSYFTSGIDIAKAVAAQVPGVSLAVAGNPSEKQSLEAAGVKQFIHANCDVPEVLTLCQKILGIV